MDCIYSNGYSLSNVCLDNNIAGIKTFYIANFSGVTSWSADPSNIITGSTNSPATWFEVQQKREQGTYTQAHAQSETGANVWTIGAEMVFFKNDATVRELVRLMSQTTTVIIALRNDGQYMLLGEKNGLDLKTVDAGAGKAMEDFSGSRVNFETKQGFETRQLSETFFGSLTIA